MGPIKFLTDVNGEMLDKQLQLEKIEKPEINQVLDYDYIEVLTRSQRHSTLKAPLNVS